MAANSLSWLKRCQTTVCHSQENIKPGKSHQSKKHLDLHRKQQPAPTCGSLVWRCGWSKQRCLGKTHIRCQMLVGNVTLLAAILQSLQVETRIFGVYWLRKQLLKLIYKVFYSKCGYQEILNYIYGYICGSNFVESSDLGLLEGYVWFLHNVSLNLRELLAFVVWVIGFLFLSVGCPLTETRTYSVTSNMFFPFRGYSVVYSVFRSFTSFPFNLCSSRMCTFAVVFLGKMV